jgi:hypothetical protein
MSLPEPIRSKGPSGAVSYAALALVFLASRLAYIYAGVRFDWDPLRSSLAILDPELLRTDLLRTLLYSHSQPPLFNLFVGVVLKCAPAGPFPVFRILYVGMGLAMTFALQASLVRLHVPSVLAFVLCAAVMISPATILFENLLFYTYPVALMLILSVLVLQIYLRTGTMTYAWMFFGLLGCIVLTRSLFHPLWFVLASGALIAAGRGRRSRLLVAAAVPLLVIVLWSAKNLVLFGSASSSSWLGMSLCKMVTVGVPEGERVRLVEEGVLSPYALRRPYQGIDEYRDLLPHRDSTGVPVLDREVRSTGNMNLNHSAYIDISGRYFRDALVLIRIHPGIYLRGVVHALFLYFRPASEYLSFHPNRPSVQGLDRAVNGILLGQRAYERPGFEANDSPLDYAWQVRRTGIIIAFVWTAVILWALARLWKCLRAPGAVSPRCILLVYVLGTLLYVTVVGNLLEIGENCRFRFSVDPLFVVLLSIPLTEGITRFREKRNSG